MPHVKTAISLPKQVFDDIDGLARERGASRSSLVTEAIELFLAQERELDLRRRLKEAYAEPTDVQERADLREFLTLAARSVLRDDDW